MPDQCLTNAPNATNKSQLEAIMHLQTAFRQWAEQDGKSLEIAPLQPQASEHAPVLEEVHLLLLEYYSAQPKNC